MTDTPNRSSLGSNQEGKAKAALAYLLDHVVYSDNYGVEGSGFAACRLCTGGGAPGISMDHEAECPVLRCEEIAEAWWNEKFEEQQEELHEIIKAKDAQLFVVEQELMRLRGIAYSSWQPIETAPIKPADEVTSYYRFRCLLQSEGGWVGEGFGEYTHHKRKLVWKQASGHACHPTHWQFLPVALSVSSTQEKCGGGK